MNLIEIRWDGVDWIDLAFSFLKRSVSQSSTAFVISCNWDTFMEFAYDRCIMLILLAYLAFKGNCLIPHCQSKVNKILSWFVALIIRRIAEILSDTIHLEICFRNCNASEFTISLIVMYSSFIQLRNTSVGQLNQQMKCKNRFWPVLLSERSDNKQRLPIGFIM
jgi:hypothetical protein